MNTPDNITTLRDNEIFVFGSNRNGFHDGGAARYAVEKFGAVYGNGEGMQGQCYAIPTMEGFYSLMYAVAQFLWYAEHTPEYTFFVTQIGCGIAGYSPKQIAPLFAIRPDNVIIPKEFEL
jgi:hypothetical protein